MVALTIWLAQPDVGSSGRNVLHRRSGVGTICTLQVGRTSVKRLWRVAISKFRITCRFQSSESEQARIPPWNSLCCQCSITAVVAARFNSGRAHCPLTYAVSELTS